MHRHTHLGSRTGKCGSLSARQATAQLPLWWALQLRHTLSSSPLSSTCLHPIHCWRRQLVIQQLSVRFQGRCQHCAPNNPSRRLRQSPTAHCRYRRLQTSFWLGLAGGHGAFATQILPANLAQPSQALRTWALASVATCAPLLSTIATSHPNHARHRSTLLPKPAYL
jgi:hypothetical protein